MAHRTTIWRRKKRQDFSLDSELLEPKRRPREPKDWRRVTLLDGRTRYIPKFELFNISHPAGRREKSEARDSETLNLVAQWIVDTAMRIRPGYDGEFPLKDATKHARKEIGKLPYPANMIAAAAVDGLRLGRIARDKARISRRMMHYWKQCRELDDIKASLAREISLIQHY